MPRQISIENIVDAALKGVKHSQNEYLNWSGDCWLWQAPEYLITTNIARQIFKIKGSKYITLENGTSAAIEDAGARGNGKLHHEIRADGKIDIVLWWADGTPRAIIEVKNQIYYSGQYHKDIKRIEKVLCRKYDNSSFQFGLFVFYDSATDGSRKTAVEKIENKFQNIYFKSSSLIKDNYNVSLHQTKIKKVDNSAWAAACLLIKYDNS